MGQKFCKECGAEIEVHYITPEKIYSVNENGKLERADNNDAFCPNGDLPYIEFKCSEDLEHDIGEGELSQWMETIEFDLEDSGLLLE